MLTTLSDKSLCHHRNGSLLVQRSYSRHCLIVCYAATVRHGYGLQKPYEGIGLLEAQMGENTYEWHVWREHLSYRTRLILYRPRARNRPYQIEHY